MSAEVRTIPKKAHEQAAEASRAAEVAKRESARAAYAATHPSASDRDFTYAYARTHWRSDDPDELAAMLAAERTDDTPADGPFG